MINEKVHLDKSQCKEKLLCLFQLKCYFSATRAESPRKEYNSCLINLAEGV